VLAPERGNGKLVGVIGEKNWIEDAGGVVSGNDFDPGDLGGLRAVNFPLLRGGWGFGLLLKKKLRWVHLEIGQLVTAVWAPFKDDFRLPFKLGVGRSYEGRKGFDSRHWALSWECAGERLGGKREGGGGQHLSFEDK